MTAFLRNYSRPVKIFLLLIGITVFFLTYFTVWRSDAVSYMYIIPMDDIDRFRYHIRDLGDIWQSQINHYFVTNGRFVVHYIVQVFCGILGEGAFAFFNACVWMILPLLMLDIAGEKRPSLKAVMTATVLAVSVFYGLRFDPPMHVNYIWTALASLFWFKLFFSERKYVWWQLVLVGIYSYLAGEGNESFTAPLSAAIIVYFIWKRCKFSRKQWVMAVFYALGAITLVAAPGAWGRAAITDATVTHSLTHLLRGVGQISIFPIIAGISLCMRKSIRKSVLGHREWVFTVTVIVASYLLAIYLYRAAIERIALCGSLFLAVFLLSKLRNYSYRTGALAVFACVALLLLSTTVYDTVRCNRVEQEINDAYGKSTDGIAYIPDADYGYQYEELCYTDSSHIASTHELYPGKPSAVVRPAAMKRLPLDKDTNLVVKIAPQAWLMLRSKTHPAEFVINKKLLPGVLDLNMPPRQLNFGKHSDVVFEESDLWQAAVYCNRRPYLQSEVTMESPR